MVPLELAPAAIRQFRPDLVVAVGSIVPDASDLRGLRRAVDSIGAELAYWLHDDPYEFDYSFKAELTADIIFSNDSWAVHHYRHGNVHHLPLAASRARHFRDLVPVAGRETVVFFCGVAYPNRVALIRRADAVLSRHPVAILGTDWPSDIRCATNRRLTPAEMTDHAADARLTLNIGRDLDIANRRFALPPATPGPRTFEVALAGSAQLFFATGLEICDAFEPGREILLVDGVADIARAIEQALDDPAAIQAIAARAQNRALREHTYTERAARILDLCRSTIALGGLSDAPERPRFATARR
ncbi:glycosyltransferase family protein [Methylobacterium sp. Leaf99]|jgi:spore maturation protein CgeB|uniref:glycosyltransferase family protein n=1 Tax=Methylobacterium sp. Leaf99 TaxID=1736251 RepID=UPI000B3402EA|nr:glycosyltransferase [Methylobacterium sp. Leaf99]